MASETGHTINISNFKLVIDQCTGFGAKYNPSNTDLTIANMTTVWTTADTANGILNKAVSDAKNPINEREIVFAPLNKLVTRTLAILSSSKVSKPMMKDAKGIADKIRGFGVEVKKLPDGTPDPDHVSKSQQGFVQRAKAFKQLVDLYKSEPKYAPNEADLTTTALATMATQMKTLNNNIGTILAPVDAARITRDHALYDEDTGIVDLAQMCKNYVKGVYGTTSSEHKLIRKIKFTRKKT